MKANHNKGILVNSASEVVVNISISKNESKSQLVPIWKNGNCVVVNISISKNESKSQRRKPLGK